MSAQIFSRRSRFTTKREASIAYPLHPWIAEATKKPSAYYANPDKPKIFRVVNDSLLNISDAGTPPYLKTGDLVWLSFTDEFINGAISWATTMTPCEIVHVGTVSPELVGRALPPPPEEDSTPRRFLQAGITFVMSEPVLDASLFVSDHLVSNRRRFSDVQRTSACHTRRPTAC